MWKRDFVFRQRFSFVYIWLLDGVHNWGEGETQEGSVREREEWKMQCSFHLLVQSSKNWFPKENFKGTNSCELSQKMRTLPVFWWHTQQLCERRQEVGNYTTSEGTTVISMLWQRKVWDFGAAKRAYNDMYRC